MPQGPLSPRHSVIAFAVGNEVFFVGGDASRPCGPPAGDCVHSPLLDGVAFNVRREEWRRIANLPSPVQRIPNRGVAVVGASAYVFGRDFLSYDSSRDRWSQHAAPEGWVPDQLTAIGNRIVGWQRHQSTQPSEHAKSPDRVFDPRTNDWTELPRDPLAPSTNRTMLWAGSKLWLFGIPSRARPRHHFAAASYDFRSSTWVPVDGTSTFDPGDTQRHWYRAGDQAIFALTNAANDGQAGHEVYADGGAPVGGTFDFRTSRWAALPESIPVGTYEGAEAAGSEVIAFRGTTFNFMRQAWAKLDNPVEVGPDSRVEGRSAIWLGRTLFVWGGFRSDLEGESYEALSSGFSWSSP